jgi:inositol phosphorylceramide mannosyltransferase catalytic subunit
MCVVSILLHRSRYLFGLLFEDGKGDAVLPSVLLSPSSEMGRNETAVIPRIIHQTYKSEEIPEHWRGGQQAVRRLHPDWEYMVYLPLSYPYYLTPSSMKNEIIEKGEADCNSSGPMT